MLFKRVSASQLLRDFRKGGSVVKAMEEVIERSEKAKHYNHFTFQDHKAMLDNAIKAQKAYQSGNPRPLEGIPLGVKDNINTTDSPTTGGSPTLKGHIPKFNSTLMVKLFGAGVINAGKMNMHEFAYGTTTNNAYYGPARCAQDPERSAGGSSGGSGGAVGLGTLPIALGTDTGGSIRHPAASNGCVGYKPTIGRWPADYGIKMTHERDTIGPIATCMEDVVLFDEIVTRQFHRHRVQPKDVRIGVPNSHFYDNLSESVKEHAMKCLEKLRKAGFVLVEGDGMQGIGELNTEATIITVVGFEIFKRLQEYLDQNGLTISQDAICSNIQSPDVKALIDATLATPVSEEEFSRTIFTKRVELKEMVNAYFERNSLDCMIYPSMLMDPPLISELKQADFTIEHNGKRVPQITTSISNLDISSNTNSPAITLPIIAHGSGLPVGMELFARSNEDARLIAVAREVESAVAN